MESEVNLKFINLINQFLAIQTPIAMSSDYHLAEGKTDRLLSLCQQAGADVYLSGPAAQSYLDTDAFERAKIQVKWANYSNYPEYPQLHPPFEHGVSVLDLLFNTGPDALKYMKNLL